MVNRLKRFFLNETNIVILNAIILVFGIAGNLFFQIFCIPTNWAIVVIVICFTNSIIHPILNKKKELRPITSLINGVSFCFFIYCIIFLGLSILFGIIAIIFFGLGLIAFIPHYFALQLFWKEIVKSKSKIGKTFFILGILISLSLVINSNLKFKEALVDVEKFKNSNYEELNTTFMTEKILGMGLIYHVELCLYDGWRPPKHEPMLNIGLWLNNGLDPLKNMTLEKRLALYKQFFPEKKVKFNCSCAIEYSKSYHEDSLWMK